RAVNSWHPAVIVDRGDHVPAGIENTHHKGNRDRRDACPAHASEGKRREAEKDGDCYGERGQATFKSEGRQRKKWEACPDCARVRGIEGKKVVCCFVKHMDGQGQPEPKPGESKTAIDERRHQRHASSKNRSRWN